MLLNEVELFMTSSKSTYNMISLIVTKGRDFTSTQGLLLPKYYVSFPRRGVLSSFY